MNVSVLNKREFDQLMNQHIIYDEMFEEQNDLDFISIVYFEMPKNSHQFKHGHK